MVKFLHIGDLHLHTSNEKEDNKNWIKVRDYILEHYANEPNEKPIIVQIGDIVDDGSEKQYKNAVETFKPLVENGFKILACPGNHDYGFRGNVYTEKSQALYQKYILGELLNNEQARDGNVKMEDLYPMVDEINDVLFIGVDSVVGNENQLLHFASGEVGDEQRKTLAKLLAEHSGKKIVVYFHHHPFCQEKWTHKLTHDIDDSRKVMRLLSSQIDMLCFGHEHKPEIWNGESDIDWILAAGKTSSLNKMGKLQFREVIIDGDHNTISTKSFKPPVTEKPAEAVDPSDVGHILFTE
jgi:3',5'-cyclic AMP phosphodiesterase CpdA